MTDDLIARLSADLQPVAPRALERRLGLALLLGLAGTILIGPLVLDLIIGRPFGGAWGDPMFWGKLAYTIGLGALGLVAVPALSRPDRRLIWPLLAAVGLFLVALVTGSAMWMWADWAMPMLMGGTALVCPWLIILTAAPLLAALGPEPLSEAFDGDYLFERSRGRAAPVKTFLMDGHVVVGVGNIYANEALHRAGVRPTRRAHRLSAADCNGLAAAVKETLAAAIRRSGAV